MLKQDIVAMSVCIGFAALLVGIILGAILRESFLHREAIEKGFAEYHPTTGDWQWKESD